MILLFPRRRQLHPLVLQSSFLSQNIGIALEHGPYISLEAHSKHLAFIFSASLVKLQSLHKAVKFESIPFSLTQKTGFGKSLAIDRGQVQFPCLQSPLVLHTLNELVRAAPSISTMSHSMIDPVILQWQLQCSLPSSFKNLYGRFNCSSFV